MAVQGLGNRSGYACLYVTVSFSAEYVEINAHVVLLSVSASVNMSAHFDLASMEHSSKLNFRMGSVFLLCWLFHLEEQQLNSRAPRKLERGRAPASCVSRHCLACRGENRVPASVDQLQVCR